MVEARAQTNGRLLTLVLSVLLAVLLGWLLKIGQGVLLPVFAAVIAVYVLITSAGALARVPLMRRWPQWLLRTLVLLAFLAVAGLLAAIIGVTADQVLVALPRYQANLKQLAASSANMLGMDRLPDWQTIWAATVGRLDLQAWAVTLVASLGSMAGTVFLVLIYAAFLLGERAGFAHKLAVALPGGSAQQTQAMIRDINDRIGQYLTTKTLINVILAVPSFVVLWLFGVDFALFWALLIGILNYIPYVGSAVGVLLPVLLSLAQFGSLGTTLLIGALLMGLQMWVGNVLEPRMLGRQVNLSPFVVMLALSFWTALWGVAGAILAIPLTSMIAIVLNAFDATRPLAVLLAHDVSGYAKAEKALLP